MRSITRSGSGLISLLLALAIIAFLVWWMMGRTGQEVEQARMARNATSRALVETDLRQASMAVQQFLALYGEPPTLNPNPCTGSCTLEGSQGRMPLNLSPGVSLTLQAADCQGGTGVLLVLTRGNAQSSRKICSP